MGKQDVLDRIKESRDLAFAYYCDEKYTREARLYAQGIADALTDVAILIEFGIQDG